MVLALALLPADHLPGRWASAALAKPIAILWMQLHRYIFGRNAMHTLGSVWLAVGILQEHLRVRSC